MLFQKDFGPAPTCWLCLLVAHLIFHESQYLRIGLNLVICRCEKLNQSELMHGKMACFGCGLREMNNLEKMIAEKLSQSDVHFDASGADAKVQKIAHQDLVNYLKHHWDMVGKEESDIKLASRIEASLKEEPAEFEAFLSFWTGMWQRKWTQRVKLLIGNQTQDNKNSNEYSQPHDIESKWKKLNGRREVVELVVSNLVKNGELCATEILAENILKTELSKKVDFVNSKQQVIELLDAALHKARDLSKTVSPMIFVKVDRGYYRAATA